MSQAESTTIDRFTGEYNFLSNFYQSPITLGGVTFPTVEHAFQAAKCIKAEDVIRVQRAVTPGAAKRIGRTVHMRKDWEDVKYDAMKACVRAKFADPVLAEKLMATGNAELIEGNDWGDRQWGQVNGVGKNWLGIILMAVRMELQDQWDMNVSIETDEMREARTHPGPDRW